MIFGFSLQDKFGIFIAAIIAVVIAGMSFFFFYQLDYSLMSSLRTELVDVSKIIARNIDHKAIQVVLAGNEKSKAYWDLKKYLKSVQLQDRKMKSVYVMVKTKNENVWKFVADEDLDPKTMTHLNEEYDVSSYPEMRMAFGGPIADQNTTKDRWGRWLSGYAPIYNLQGHAVAIVGVNMSADDVDYMRKNIRDLVIMSFVIGLALAIVFGRVGAITITGPILELVRGVKHIEEGRYGIKIEIARKDEIGELVHGFNRMSDKLGEVDKIKSDFLSVISHELYTPITPIRDSVSQLLQYENMTETSKQLLGIIDRQIKKMQNLVDEILDFSWLEIRDWKLEKQPALLKLLGEGVLDEVSDLARKKSVKLNFKTSKDLPTIMIDKKRIHHVLKILLDNAIKFTPEKGDVTLEIDKVSGGVEFAVADTGIGIARENLEKIFTDFYQVEDHLTRTSGGVGLGLSIAKRIIDAHNGYLWAESQGLGEGSRFIFLLPIT